MTAKLLGAVAYARHRKEKGLPGQTHAAVKKAIDRGTLTKKSVEKDPRGRAKIDPALADAEWEASTDPAQQRDPAQARGRWSGSVDGAKAGALNPEIRVDAGALGDGEAGALGDGEAGAQASIRQAQAVLITFRAKNSQLEYETRAGLLCNVAEVDAEAYRLGRLVRENVLNLTAKISAQLAAETNQHKVSRLLTDELIAALEALVPMIEKGPGDPDPEPAP